jgi:uncharacterized phage-associated protein
MDYNAEKLKAMILYISSHPVVTDIGLTKLYKIIYFADVTHLRETGESITGSDYIKYQHGPVPSRGERCLKRLRKEGQLHSERQAYDNFEHIALTPLVDPPANVLTAAQSDTLDQVCRELGPETASQLSDRSHQEPAWIAASMQDKMPRELMYYGATEDLDGL